MEPVSLRAKLGWVGMGYAVVAAISTFLVLWRSLQYRLHPDDANQYSGMWAGGDMILGLFIFFLLMLPTFSLVLIGRNSESLYTGYTKVIFGLSLTAPASVGILAVLMIGQSNSLLGWACMWRLVASPGILFAIVGSRLLARLPRIEAAELVCGANRGGHLGRDDFVSRIWNQQTLKRLVRPPLWPLEAS